MNWPILGIIIPTFQRHDIVPRTVLLLQRYLTYSGQIKVIVSEDGPDLPMIASENVRVTRGPGRGLGANLNAMLEPCEFEVVLQIDDDFWLGGGLDLDRHVQTLIDEPRAGWIRLMDIAGHDYAARLIGAYWWVDWTSPGLYISSNRAHLKHRRFHDAFGFYAENRKLADTENEFCQRCKDRAGHSLGWPQVLVPLDVATESLWQHVGKSWQKEGY